MATRAGRARRRFARAVDEVRELRDRIVDATPEGRPAATKVMIERLRKIADSSIPLWQVAAEAGLLDGEGDFETRALIAQIVNAALAGTTPGTVHNRYARAKA
jgi:hypothetical protein